MTAVKADSPEKVMTLYLGAPYHSLSYDESLSKLHFRQAKFTLDVENHSVEYDRSDFDCYGRLVPMRDIADTEQMTLPYDAFEIRPALKAVKMTAKMTAKTTAKTTAKMTVTLTNE